MTGLDAGAFWAWVRDNPPETIEQLVLQHVRINRVDGGRKSTKYTVLDVYGHEITEIMVSASTMRKPGFTPQKAITEALLKRIICVKCGTRLLEGEVTVCSPCEATQVMDLLRMQRELLED